MSFALDDDVGEVLGPLGRYMILTHKHMFLSSLLFGSGSVKIQVRKPKINISVCFFKSRNVIRVLIAQEPGSGCKKKDPNPALKIEMLIRICWSNCDILIYYTKYHCGGDKKIVAWEKSKSGNVKGRKFKIAPKLGVNLKNASFWVIK